jgi:FtsP/CotA-like multicopper oxidase with cupredoxin domain
LQSVARTDHVKNGLDTPTASIMQFRVGRKVAHDSTRIPSRLLPAPKINAPSRVAMTWNIGLGGNKTTGTFWTINGKAFNPKRIDFRVRRGATQTWKLHNGTHVTHFFHLHEEAWRTISRDGHRPPPWERGLEDTWKLDPGETVKVAAHFTDYRGVFMLHCHMLDHEDHGLMTQFKVVKPGAPAGRVATTSSRPTSSSLLVSGATLRSMWCTPEARASLRAQFLAGNRFA